MSMIRRTIAIFFMLLFGLGTILPASRAWAQTSEGGIAISGSFYRHHFKLTPGEKMISPDVDIIIYNNYPQDIEVVLTGETPKGVKFDIDQLHLMIPANSYLTQPVGLIVDESVAPGEYKIGIAADVVPPKTEGISIVGSAQLRTDLTVFGEAGTIRITTTLLTGEPIAGEMHIFQVEGNQLLPAGYAESTELSDRLVPGDYVVTVYWQGKEVATEKFTIKVDEVKELPLKVHTTFVQGLTAAPQLDDNQNLASARINYSIENIHHAVKDVRVMLEVKFNGEKVDEMEMFNLPTLDLGSQNSRYTYIPPKGWRNGDYTFKVTLLGTDDVVQAESTEYVLNVNLDGAAGSSIPLNYIGIGVGALLLVVVSFLLGRRRK